MTQFDVHANPVPAARRAYPWVVVLQSDVVASAAHAIVAPLAPRAALGSVAGRLTPVLRLDAGEFVALVPALATVRRGDMGPAIGSAASARDALLAAIDLLFCGV